MAQLEESRRKLVNLRMQKNLASGTYSPVTGASNGTLSPLELPDKSMGLRELKDSIEEAEVLKLSVRIPVSTEKPVKSCVIIFSSDADIGS